MSAILTILIKICVVLILLPMAIGCAILVAFLLKLIFGKDEKHE